MVLSTTKKTQCTQSITNNTCILGGPKKSGIISMGGRNANLSDAIFSRGAYSNGNMPLGCIAGLAYLKANNLLTNNPSCSGGVGRMTTNNTRCAFSSESNNKNIQSVQSVQSVQSIPNSYLYEFTSLNPIADYGLGYIQNNNRINSYNKLIPFAIIQISNSGQTESGELLEELIKNTNRKFTMLSSLPRKTVNMNQFESTLIEYLSNDDLRVIITIGGTGVSPTDNVPDVCAKYYEKYLPGFGELFRHLTYIITCAQRYIQGFPSIDSRSSAGIIKNKIIYSLPGSPQAVKLGFVEIINESTHPIIAQLDKI